MWWYVIYNNDGLFPDEIVPPFYFVRQNLNGRDKSERTTRPLPSAPLCVPFKTCRSLYTSRARRWSMEVSVHDDRRAGTRSPLTPPLACTSRSPCHAPICATVRAPENWLSPCASRARLLYFSRAVGVPLTHTSQSPTLPIDEAQCAYDDGEVVVACAGDLARLARLAWLGRFWQKWSQYTKRARDEWVLGFLCFYVVV